MDTEPLHRRSCKYSIYLSKSFQTLDGYSDIIEQITRAGLLLVSSEQTTGVSSSLEKSIQQAIDDADIFVLYLANGLESTSPDPERPVAEVEYECARNSEIPLLIYQAGDVSLEDGTNPNWVEEIHQTETYRILNNELEFPSILVADLLKMIMVKPDSSFWIRSNINADTILSIIKQKSVIDEQMRNASNIILNHEKHLNASQRDQVIGPLIEKGLRPNISGQAYLFAVKQSPVDEIQHERLDYRYCIDRFDPDEGGAIYDRMLDVTWLLISDQSFSWLAAMDWRNHLKEPNRERIAAYPPDLDGGPENDWRLPSIEELMTLITRHKLKADFLDKVFFPGDVHWFWSSSAVKDEEKAYYIETTQGSVLKDVLDHWNAILLCCKGKPQGLDQPVVVANELDSDRELDILMHANQSRHIYGVHVTILKSGGGHNNETDNLLVHTLQQAGFAVECNLGRLSRTVMKETEVLEALQDQDAYVLVIEKNTSTQMLETGCMELRMARSLNLPVFIYHNVADRPPQSLQKKLDLSDVQLKAVRKFKDTHELATDLVSRLAGSISQNGSTGWIRRNEFEAISECIEKINQARSLQDEAEPLVNHFIEHCKVKKLREEFEKCGLVSRKPDFGEQSRFASRNNPIQSFFPQDEAKRSYELPILFDTIPNRFLPLVIEDERVIVDDCYLKIRWWAVGVKRTTYPEALEYAQKISQQENETWRLPTVDEMATLITHSRRNRKYMDEKVFPLGRWFWTGSVVDEMVYYVDYNYLQGSIRQEDVSQYGDEFPVHRKKSVILVSDEYPTRASRDAAQDDQKKLQKGKKAMDPTTTIAVPVLLKTVDFLFGEVSKILKERRDHRKELDKEKKDTNQKKDVIQTAPEAAPTTKEEVLQSAVIVHVWQDEQENIEHLVDMLHLYTKNYRQAEKQKAMYGEADVPPITLHRLDEAGDGIAKTTRELEKALTRVYGRKIVIVQDE